MKERVDIQLLRMLPVLFDEKSVTRAADRLGVSQPTASRALAQLRALFGDPLLLRTRNGMIPTNRGLEIEKFVQKLLADLNSLTAQTSPFDPAVSRRTFVVTAPEYAEHVLMPLVYRRLRESAPYVRIEVRAVNSTNAYELMERGEIDLRIAWLLEPPLSMRSMPLFQDHIVCIADRNHPTIGDSLSLEQYFSLPHVRAYGSGRTTTGQLIDTVAARYGKKLVVPFVVRHFLTIPYAIIGTDTIATLPRALAVQFEANHPIRVLDVPLKLPRVKYSAYWHERHHLDPGHKWLRSVVRNAASELNTRLF